MKTMSSSDSEISRKRPKRVKRVRFSDDIDCNISDGNHKKYFKYDDPNLSSKNLYEKCDFQVESTNNFIPRNLKDLNPGDSVKESEKILNEQCSENLQYNNEMSDSLPSESEANFKTVDTNENSELSKLGMSSLLVSRCMVGVYRDDIMDELQIDDQHEIMHMDVSTLNSSQLKTFSFKECVNLSKMHEQKTCHTQLISTFVQTDIDAHLNEVIDQTKHLSLQSSSSNFCKNTVFDKASLSTNREKQRVLQFAASHIPNISLKKSVKRKFIEKQSAKINNLLSTKDIDLNSQSLVSAVFNSWCEVKVQNLDSSANNKEKFPESEKKKDAKYVPSKVVHLPKKHVKPKLVSKQGENIFQQPISKVDPEENKMAYEAWKKQKEQILKQQEIEKREKDREEKMKKAMDEKIRKHDAQTAYYAWNTHKLHEFQSEKQKQDWMQQRIQEKTCEKLRRKEMSKKMYDEWLMSKMNPEKSKKSYICEDKPPWFPPGKGDVLM